MPDVRPDRLLRLVPGRHAGRHARAQGHPVIRSVEPGEDWSWCYVDQVAFVLDPSDYADTP